MATGGLTPLSARRERVSQRKSHVKPPHFKTVTLLFPFFIALGILHGRGPDTAMVHPIYRLFSTSASLAPTILRWLLGVVFCVHGGQKTLGWMGGAGWSGTLTQWTDPHGLDLSYALAALGILAELAGAVGMLLGLMTRMAALGLMGVMATAIATVHWQAGFLAQNGGYEYPLSLGVVAFSLLLTGGGRFSLDGLITRRLLPPNTRMLGSYRHYSAMML